MPRVSDPGSPPSLPRSCAALAPIRAVNKTLMNEESSRSHLVFNIKVIGFNKVRKRRHEQGKEGRTDGRMDRGMEGRRV